MQIYEVGRKPVIAEGAVAILEKDLQQIVPVFFLYRRWDPRSPSPEQATPRNGAGKLNPG